MGALDDAIREHLELKRQHGASEDELKQQEQEAFGPAPIGAWQTSPAEPSPAEESASEDDRTFDAAEHTFGAEGPPERDPEELREEIRATDAIPAASEPNGLDPDQLAPDEVLPEDSLESGSGAAIEDWGRGEGPNGTSERIDSTDEVDVSDDVLEETPEFLEDAPEQDQLWFEQKPPKDFDFGD